MKLCRDTGREYMEGHLLTGNRDSLHLVRGLKNELSGLHLPPPPSEVPKTRASMQIKSKFGPIGAKHFTSPRLLYLPIRQSN